MHLCSFCHLSSTLTLKTTPVDISLWAGIFITKDVKVDLGTLLSTTTSTLKYSAQKEDDGAVFTCRAKHIVGEPITSSITLNVTCESLHAIVCSFSQIGPEQLTIKLQ